MEHKRHACVLSDKERGSFEELAVINDAHFEVDEEHVLDPQVLLMIHDS